jgi:phage-related protein (TIGR01555 family)
MATGERKENLASRLRRAWGYVVRGDRADSVFKDLFGTNQSSIDPYAGMAILVHRRRLTELEVFELYRSFGIAANAVDVPAEDMTRAGFRFCCPDDSALEDAVEQKLRDLNVQSVLHDVCRYEFLTGDGFALIGVEGGGASLETDVLELAQAGRLQRVAFLHPFHGYKVEDIELEEDILSPRYGEDKFIVLRVGGERVRVHASRVLHLQMRAFHGEKFGRSIYERLLSTLQVIDTTHWSVGQLMYSLFFKVIKSPRFDGMTEEQRQAVLRRLSASLNALTYFVLGMDEEMEIVSPSARLSGFDGLTSFLWDMLAAATRIPKHHLLGQRQGVLAGAEWDTRTYFARIKALQESYLRELIEHLVRLILLSREFGVDPGSVGWKIEFNPLFVESEQEQNEREFKRAQMHAIYLQYGVVAPDEVREELDWVEGAETPLERVAPENPDIVSPGKEPTPPRPGTTTPSAGVRSPSAFKP